MRNITACERRLAPSIDEDSFERASHPGRLPHVSGQPRDEDTPFLRSLHRATMARRYLSLVDSTQITDRNFHGIQGPLIGTGATVSEPRFWPLTVSVPDDASAAWDKLADASDNLHDLLAVDIALGFDQDQQAFKMVLANVLAAEVAQGSTHVNGVTSGTWYRDDSTELTGLRYHCKAVGYFTSPLDPLGVDPVQQAGGEVLQSETYLCVGSAAADSLSPQIPLRRPDTATAKPYVNP
jgi:hypothetical protein